MDLAALLEKNAQQSLAPSWEKVGWDASYPATPKEVSELLKVAGIHLAPESVAEYGDGFTAIQIVHLAFQNRAQR